MKQSDNVSIQNQKASFFGVGDEISLKCKNGNCVAGTISCIELKKEEKIQPLIDISITEEGYYPGQKASVWMEDIEELEILNLKGEIVPNDEYTDFIQKCLADIEGQDKKNYIFKLKRWRKEMPFWCIFFCERSNPAVSKIKEQHCIALKETTKMTDLLSALADSGVFTKVSQRYFLNIDEDEKGVY